MRSISLKLLMSLIFGLLIILLITTIFIPKEREVEMEVPAILGNGTPVMAHLELILKGGMGKTFIDVSDVVLGEGFIFSVKEAVNLGFNYTGKNRERFDIVLKVNLGSALAEGSSSNAAIVLMTIALLKNRKINSNLTVSGYINSMGSLEGGSNLLKKAEVCKNKKKVLLVPPYAESKLMERFNCTKQENVLNCKGNFRMIEVKTLKEMLGYIFLN